MCRAFAREQFYPAIPRCGIQKQACSFVGGFTHVSHRHVTGALTMNFYVGTSGYSYTKWKGSFYPAKMSTKEMLGFYAARFRSVEINNTFYRPPAASVLEGWAGQVPASFRFVLKAPQEITHFRRLTNVVEFVSSFLEAAGTLGKRLGPLLFQLPPNFRRMYRGCGVSSAC